MNTHESASAPSSSRPPLAQRVFAWAGILFVPALWMIHLLLSVLLIATACAGGPAQRNALPWPLVEAVVRIGSAFAFALALACTVFAWRAWHAAVNAAHAHAQSDTRAGAAEAIDHGKHRFLALCGAMTSAGFTAGLVFTASVLIAASPSQLCEPFQ